MPGRRLGADHDYVERAERAASRTSFLNALSREQQSRKPRASKASPLFGPILKASMVGFTLLSCSYYYLRRRSPGPRSRPTTVRQGNGGL